MKVCFYHSIHDVLIISFKSFKKLISKTGYRNHLCDLSVYTYFFLLLMGSNAVTILAEGNSLIYRNLTGKTNSLINSQNKNNPTSFKPIKSLISKLYVSNFGNDANQGTFESPFQTLKHAIDVAKISDKRNVSIILRGGAYQIIATIPIVGLNDKELIITNYENEKVNIIGGVQLDYKKFHKITDKSIRSRFYSKIVDNIYMTNLRDCGVTDYGALKAFSWALPSFPTALELFYNDVPLTIARWPNNSFLEIGDVLERGSFKDSVMPKIRFSFDRPYHWFSKSNIWAWGHMNSGYCYDNIPLDSIDLKKKEFNFGAKASYGLIKSTNQDALNKVRGYYLYNILEELDTAGEWYLDRSNGNIFIYPSSSQISEKDKIQVSILEEPLLVINKSDNVHIQNVEFSCTRGVGVQFDECTNSSLNNCSFFNTGLAAIKVTGCTNVNIDGCSIAHTGAGGVSVNGGDRKLLKAGNNSVSNCDIYDYSRVFQCYSPAVSLSGVGNSIFNCYIHNAPDQAIIFSGNNHLISNNHIVAVCSDYSDMGAIYTDKDPSSTGTEITNNFFENIKSFGTVCAVYMDDGSGGIEVKNNLFYNCGSGSQGAIHINGGGNNLFENNVFINCGLAFSNTIWSDEGWKWTFFKDLGNLNKLIKKVDIRSSIYTNRYPFLKGFFDSTHLKPRNNYISNSICYNVKSLVLLKSSYIVNNTYSSSSNPGFKDIENEDFRMITIPDEVKKWKGWTPFEFDKIGIQTRPIK